MRKTQVIKYDKRKKCSDWLDKTLWTYKDKEKIEDEKGIISTFVNEKKIDVETTFEVHGNRGIISTSNMKKKEIHISTLLRNKK